MKQIILSVVCLLFCFTATFAQYQVTKRTTILCDLPECQEEYEASTDTSAALGFASTRSLGQTQEKGISNESGSASNAQNVYFLENLNAILFIPQTFIPLESNFNISGATGNIIKVQIYNSDKELVFQTRLANNAWNGVWKGVPQYGLFSYKITVKVDDNTSEIIEGMIVTKKPI